MCQPYVESTTVLSDKIITRNDGFWLEPEIGIKARKVMVHF